MPNEQNLIPMDQRSKNEARELGREGGRASGVARRRKKKLREAAELYLSLPVVDKRVRNKLLRAGRSRLPCSTIMMICEGIR